jgi:4-diphosphocytidyl-2-C-methyl-D-erythritol kinase
MLAFANAKINIGLNVVEKRLDGFHNLETIFYPVNIFDSIEILEGKELGFFSYGLEIPGKPEDNLCLKAFRLVQAEFKIPNVQIHLLKNIPFGAGLGGGSADAAWVLKMLNQKFELMLSLEKLENLAASLGSDCAFFIRNSAQFASGRGEILEPIDLDLQKYTFALIKPNFGISTKEAFSGLIPKPSNQNLKELVGQPIETWRGQIKNDFEESLFPKFPALEKIKNLLYEKGAIYASMSGSGSTLFGIFESGFQGQFEAPENSQLFWL